MPRALAVLRLMADTGEDVHIVIKPDKNCVVNSGLGSIRGARMAEMSYSRARNTQLQRLTDPMVWRYGQMQPTSWEDALDLVARVTVAVINEMGEEGLFVSAFGARVAMRACLFLTGNGSFSMRSHSAKTASLTFSGNNIAKTAIALLGHFTTSSWSALIPLTSTFDQRLNIIINAIANVGCCRWHRAQGVKFVFEIFDLFPHGAERTDAPAAVGSPGTDQRRPGQRA
jgi:hypothetical protein